MTRTVEVCDGVQNCNTRSFDIAAAVALPVTFGLYTFGRNMVDIDNEPLTFWHGIG